MASVSSLGVGSGLDLQGLLDKLMKVEQLPLQALQQQAASYNTKISALGSLSGVLSTFQGAAKAMMPATLQNASQLFASYSGSLADEKIGSVTIGDGAVSGSYALKVEQLATAQKIRSSAMTDQDVAAAANNGTKITITAGSLEGGAFTPSTANPTKENPARTATIDLSGMTTVEQVRDAINAQTKNTGVSASVVNDGNGNKRLLLSGQKEGSDQAFRIESQDNSQTTPSTGSGFLAYDPITGTSGFSTQTKATNARIQLDGITITSKGNTVTGVLDGVTLNLKAVGETTLNVTRDDVSKLKASLEKFVGTFNDAAKAINTMGAYDSETKKAGSLNGNRILREAQSAMRNLVFNTTLNGMELSDLGVSFASSDGTLSLDSAKLEAAIAKDPEAVANFAAEVGKAFNDKIDKIIGTGGSIQLSTEGMQTSIRDLEKREEALNMRIEAVQKRYTKQFSSLDTLLSKMNSTSNFLAQQLSSITASSK